jgi:hypothetical protein
MIGVFWVADGIVFGKAVPLSEAATGLPGLLDCSDTHADLWERSPSLRPERFRGMEYFEVPRGRVLYSVTLERAIVYLDDALLRVETRSKIAEFFSLGLEKSDWRRDDHYTTQARKLDGLFDK